MIALFDYNKHNLLMESSFKFKGYDFLYFDEGVPYYSLYRSSRKLNSFWEVKYVGEVLLHLNPNLTELLFTSLMLELTDRGSGHVIRTYSTEKIKQCCENIYYNPKDFPYVRRYRKLIFNPSKMISTEEKMSIVGKVIGSIKNKGRITEEKIYEAVEELLENKKKITYISIANKLNCTRQTVSNNMTDSIKQIITYNNILLRL